MSILSELYAGPYPSGQSPAPIIVVNVVKRVQPEIFDQRSLLVAERDHWIYFRCAASRKVVSQQRDADKQHSNPGEGGGSVALTPKSKPDIRRVSASAATRPIPTPAAVKRTPFPITSFNTCRVARRTSHPDADLACPLIHRIRDHAIDSDSSQQQGQSAEEARKNRLKLAGAIAFLT